MKILITNDDGLDCEGIQVLARTLEKSHEVWVVAPDRNRSAVSHGITMTTPLRLRRISERVYTCSGVPADCTVNGLLAVIGEKPDVVISGINQGANIGTDVIYSGTAAAARQASLYGLPAIALSLVSHTGSWVYEPLSGFVYDNLDTLISLCGKDIFLNINAPETSPYKGCLLTNLSRRTYCDSVRTFDAPDGHVYTFFVGGRIETEGDERSDWQAVENGYVSVTRVCSQPAVSWEEHFSSVEFRM